MGSYRHILVPVDFSDSARLAVEAAVDLATSFHADLTVVHVHEHQSFVFVGGPDPDVLTPFEDAARERLSREMDWIHAKLPSARSLMRRGVPWMEIVTLASEVGADLIVMSTQGRTGIPRALLGSVTEQVVRHAPTPVLTIRAVAKE
jgi:nucleotide-binding universal stress UspA family protein